jgi:predicted ribosomally synthesized peptide with SipW-like signal peptide
MKNVFLSVVIVCALAVAGIGGTLATWSDSETSYDNYVETGSLDLKVNGHDDKPWDPDGVPTKVEVSDVIPQKWYGPYEVELWNAGQGDFPAHAYLHVKRAECFNIDPKVHPVTGESTGYPDPDTGTGDYVPSPSLLKPEPELVAEYGGKVNCVEVVGIGPEGDDCSMQSHVVMAVTTSDVSPTTEQVAVDELGKWVCKEIYLFDLMPCEPRTIYLWFWLQQDTEEDWGRNYIKHPDELGLDPVEDKEEYAAALLHWKKFNDWPSWALMKDRVEIDIEFDLWLEDTPGAIVRPDSVD